MKIFQFHNYQDKAYRYLLLSGLLNMVLISNILSPILSYLSFGIKENSTFINHATIANLIPGLPFMFSVIISYIVNNVSYRKLITLVFLLVFTLSGVLIIFGITNFLVLAGIILFIGILYRAVYFSLDRQLCTIVGNRMYQFQSDFALLGSIIGAFDLKLSSYLYTNYHLKGVLICFVIGNILLYYCYRQIPPSVSVEQVIKTQKIRPLALFTKLSKYPALLSYVGLIFISMFLGGTLNLLLMKKIHDYNVPISTYTTIMSISMMVNIVSSLICKTNFITKCNKQLLLAICITVASFFIIGQITFSNMLGFGVCYVATSAVFWIFYITMTSVFFMHLQQSQELILISPLINGVIGSLYYLASFSGQLVMSFFMKHVLNYQLLFVIVVIGYVVIALLILRLKHQPKLIVSY